jgi:hypothetical protein
MNERLLAASPLSFDNAPLVAGIDWDNWLGISAPFRNRSYTCREVVERFERNDYEWDIHGTLYEPESETHPGLGFVLLHGGAGSEREVWETPDGRPGLAAVLASQGFRCLAVTFPGHYPRDGEWKASTEQRQPAYLLDRDLAPEEIADRNLKCTFNTIVQGTAALLDQCLDGYRVLAFGHSTGGPMSMFLYRFVKRVQIAGIVGWASGGPDGWYAEWARWVVDKTDVIRPLGAMSRRSVESFQSAGYEDAPELCPWGGAEEYMAWGNRHKSQMKSGLCDNQHWGHVETLREYSRVTGLPESEFVDHLRDPDPDWLSKVSVLLITGENDKNHWIEGREEQRSLERFVGEKFALRAHRTQVIVVPKYGHFGYVGLHNEKIVYCWLNALSKGFFNPIASIEA